MVNRHHNQKLMPFVLFMVAFLVGADELLLGPILAPVGDDLGVAPERITLFITAYSLAIVFAAPFFGRLSDKIGRIQVILPACALFGLSSVATGLTDHFGLALATRVMTGLASAGMLPIAFALAGDQPGSKSMKQIVLVQAGLTLGMITSPGIGALLTAFHSWRFAFIGLGCAAWLVTLLLLLVSRKATPPVSALSATASVPDLLVPDLLVPRQASFRPLLIPGALGALLAMGFGLGGGIGVFNLVGQHLRDTEGLTVGWTGMMYAGLGVVSVLGNMGTSHAMKRLGSGRAVMRSALMVCMFSSVCLFSPLGELSSEQQTSWWAITLLLVAWSLAGGVGSPALQNHISQLSERHRGALMALGMSMMHLGVAVWSGTAGFAYTQGAGWVAALSAVLFSVAIIALKPAERPMETSATE
ncbi:MFS transporter [Photobacterium sp. GSS17]|uniref:MFS transporter n=1 Tax=Photobacterium sp. GSS17 TaxID=3020715 RepID=UPI00235DDB5A|nr:MFS transporter [Photobacterium sp. GSS17]